MASFIIRKALSRDVSKLAELEQICFERPWSEDSLRHDIEENGNARVVVAMTLDGKVAGYCDIWCIADEGYINNVAVFPEYRRLHVGTFLLQAVIRISEQEGCQSQTLEVRKSNEAAIALYEKVGFREAGIRPDYYEDNHEDALIMWRIGDPDQTGEAS